MARKRSERGAAGAATAAAPAPGLGSVVALPEFLGTAGQLTADEQKLIVDEASALIQDLYVHLPLKRAMHAIDPIQALRLLRRQIESAPAGLPERRFHNQMIAIFVSLRDLHTNYILPEYFASYVAFLPFYLEECFESQTSGQCEYVVSKTMEGFRDPHFKPGVAVRYWNGVPMERAVELNADKNAGSNPDARHARGLENMTIRPMDMSLPPDEEWVVIGYNDGAADREIRIPWRIFKPDPQGGVAATGTGSGSAMHSLGMDFLTETVRRAKVRMFARAVADKARELADARSYGSSDAGSRIDPAKTSTMPDILSFRTVSTSAGSLGYLRIYSFAPPDDRQDATAFVKAFVAEVIRILGLLPQEGLIIDVRGNGGGVILAGEQLLQLFTPRRVTPARFDFINTPVTQALIGQYDDLAPWADSVAKAVETGAIYSQGFPLTPEDDANALGQIYQGPVVLITNALIYSTTDIFAAGFRDHAIGPILGTNGNTGAGGANVWDYSFVLDALPDQFKELPKGTSMRVAMRRSTRVGAMAGVPLEDLGVVPDEIHRPTRNDVFHDNADLIEHAAALLKTQPRRSLSGSLNTAGGKRTLRLETRGIKRVDVFLDRRPAASVDVLDGAVSVELPAQPATLGSIGLEGYDGDELVVAGTVRLK